MTTKVSLKYEIVAAIATAWFCFLVLYLGVFSINLAHAETDSVLLNLYNIRPPINHYETSRRTLAPLGSRSIYRQSGRNLSPQEYQIQPTLPGPHGIPNPFLPGYRITPR